jgi:outer membrane lipoprotein-sorting protein
MDLARGLYEKGRSIPSFAARGGLNLMEDKTARYVRFELIAVRPDKLILTLFDPLGRPALKAVSDGAVLTAMDYGEMVAAVGASTPENVSRVLPVGLGLDALVSVLSDSLILRPDQASASYDSDGAPTALLLATAEPEGMTSWSLNLTQGPDGPVVSGLTIKAQPHRPALSVTYGSFKTVEVDGGEPRSFPHLVDATLADGRKLTVRYDEVRLGAEIPPEVFEIAVPESYEIREL